MILCDANVLVALVDERDALHDLAIRDLRSLGSQQFVSTHSALSEMFFLLPSPYQRDRLVRYIDQLPISVLADASDDQSLADVIAWMRRYADHSPDWADAHLAGLCSHDPSLKIWSYDKEFRTIWRMLDGRPIPLVGTRPRR